MLQKLICLLPENKLYEHPLDAKDDCYMFAKMIII